MRCLQKGHGVLVKTVSAAHATAPSRCSQEPWGMPAPPLPAAGAAGGKSERKSQAVWRRFLVVFFLSSWFPSQDAKATQLPEMNTRHKQKTLSEKPSFLVWGVCDCVWVCVCVRARWRVTGKRVGEIPLSFSFFSCHSPQTKPNLDVVSTYGQEGT